MLKKVQASTLLVLLCVGCDTAAKQQRGEEARRAATEAELKQLGQSMHENQNKESSPAGAEDASPQESNESKKHESAPPSTANR